MIAKYRVKPSFRKFFDNDGSYKKSYAIQKRILWFWITISDECDKKEQVMRDCDEAQQLYDKYNGNIETIDIKYNNDSV
jgi:hypothetical protein